MIDPTKYMPVLQCYKCYNVTTRASEREKEGARIIISRYARGGRGGVLQYRGDGAVLYRLVGMGPRFEGSPYKYKLSSRRPKGGRISGT